MSKGMSFKEAERHYNASPYPSRYDAWMRPTPGLTMPTNAQGAKQSFKDECDINRIMRKYLNTGTIPQGLSVGRYGDFSDGCDYLEAQVTLKNAEAQFLALPAQLRKELDNDPAKFLDWIHDERNLDELHRLGFLTEEAAQKHVEKKARERAQREQVKTETLK